MAQPTVEAPEITVVCDGWGLDHDRIVLREGSAPGEISHGMCERCRLFTDALTDLGESPRLEEYRVYLNGVLDPRD